MAVRIEQAIHPEEEHPQEPTMAEKVVEWAQVPALSTLLERNSKLDLIMFPESEEINQETKRIANDIYAARICFVNRNDRFRERDRVPYIDFLDLLAALEEDKGTEDFIENNSELMSFIVEHTTQK